jgi:hypothetical protein
MPGEAHPSCVRVPARRLRAARNSARLSPARVIVVGRCGGSMMMRLLRDPRGHPAGLSLRPGWKGMSGPLCWCFVAGRAERRAARRGDAPPGRPRQAREGCRGGIKRAGGRGFQKNTGDLQWKMRAVCNASPCASERKATSARTMGSNGKTMRRAMETGGNPGRAPTSGCAAASSWMGEAWSAETQSAGRTKLRARKRQTRIYAIAQLSKKRKQKPRYPRLLSLPGRFNKRLVPRYPLDARFPICRRAPPATHRSRRRCSRWRGERR